MSFLIVVALILAGVGLLVLAIVTLLFLVAPVGIGLLVGYGVWRLVAALRAIEKERAATRERREGEANV